MDEELMSPVMDVCTKQSAMSENAICRICHDSGAQEELLSPCGCSGTMATVHRSCLDQWLSASRTSTCELCHHQFAVQGKNKPLLKWMQNPGVHQHALFGDIVCFLFSGWLCLHGAMDHLYLSRLLKVIGIITLTVVLFTIYLFWTLRAL